MPIRRWMRHTDSSMPSLSSASLPGEHVLIDAVDERAVEIEQESGGLGRRLRGCHHNKPFGPIDGRASIVKVATR